MDAPYAHQAGFVKGAVVRWRRDLTPHARRGKRRDNPMTTQTKRIFVILGATYAILLAAMVVLAIIPYFTSWTRFRQLVSAISPFLFLAWIGTILISSLRRKDTGEFGETGDGAGE